MINRDNFNEFENLDFQNCYSYALNNKMPDYIEDWINYSEKYPNRIPKTIKRLNSLLQTYKKMFTYDKVIVGSIILWISRNIFIENGKKIVLTPVQKMIIASIFGFYDGKNRVIEEVTLIIGSGFGKSTLISALNALFLEVPEIFGVSKIFVGANVHKQARIVFEKTQLMLKRGNNNNYRYLDSSSRIIKKNTEHNLEIISSKEDNVDGIEPTIIIIDEIHARKSGGYISSLKKNRSKQRNMLTLEISTQGTTRGAYLDGVLDYGRKILSGDITSFRELFIIFENESVEEIVNAYKTGDYDVYYKSNPNLNFTQQNSEEFNIAVKKMIDNPVERPTTLTKRFNIPQNPESSYYTADECITKKFDEAYFYGKAVFLGLDVASTRNPDSDLTALTILSVNPNNGKRRHLDYFFIPSKYQDNEQKTFTTMVEDKSKVDKIDYQYFIDRGDMVIVDDTQITQKFIIDFIRQKISELNLYVLKFGIDPNKADDIVNTFNSLTNDTKFCLPFLSERKVWNTPIIESSKEARSLHKVHDNNKLTEIHFAKVMAKYDGNDYIIFTNNRLERKDMVIAHMSAYSAYDVWSRQIDKKNNISNYDNLKASYPIDD